MIYLLGEVMKRVSLDMVITKMYMFHQESISFPKMVTKSARLLPEETLISLQQKVVTHLLGHL
jgi:hypothetical protein